MATLAETRETMRNRVPEKRPHTVPAKRYPILSAKQVKEQKADDSDLWANTSSYLWLDAADFWVPLRSTEA